MGRKTNRPYTLTVYNHRERIESFALKPPLSKLHNQNALVLETTESGKLMSHTSSEINLSLNYFLAVIIDCYFFLLGYHWNSPPPPRGFFSLITITKKTKAKNQKK